MPINRVFIAGAGLMGHGIAQVLAATGRPVTMYEPDLERAVAGRVRILGSLERAVAKGRLKGSERDATIQRIAVTDDPARVRGADLVIEAVFEDVAVKTELWTSLDAIASEHAIFATNTSAISIDLLAGAVSEARRERFLGMHFFSPVPLMPLVEIIRGSATSDEAPMRNRPGCSQSLPSSSFITNWKAMASFAVAMPPAGLKPTICPVISR